ncbi:MAG: DUF1295 domain-containing protein [Anaerolineae bacterium]|nr:DUF1295 domain-containing protein [Anaerolineae bacterium]
MSIVIVLVLGFGLLHSLTADRRLKEWIAAIIGQRAYEGWYRLTYNVFSVLLLSPALLAMALLGNTILYRVPDLLVPIFLILQLIGIGGLVIATLQIDVMRFAGIRQAITYLRGEPLPLPPEPLQTGGLYAWVRHPLYFFSMMAIWFVPVMTDGLLAFNLGATAYFLIGSMVEERRMLRTFGEEYATYQQRVPWMFPLLRW